MNYTDLINIFNCSSEDGEKMWTSYNITSYMKLPNGDWEVKLLQETGEETQYYMKTTKENTKLNLDAYTRENDILNMSKWKWERCLINNHKKFIRIYKIIFVQTERYTTKYTYADKVPWNVKEAIKFDQQNGNVLYQNVTGREMYQIKGF